jgi:hypothetical protein
VNSLNVTFFIIPDETILVLHAYDALKGKRFSFKNLLAAIVENTEDHAVIRTEPEIMHQQANTIAAGKRCRN